MVRDFRLLVVPCPPPALPCGDNGSSLIAAGRSISASVRIENGVKRTRAKPTLTARGTLVQWLRSHLNLKRFLSFNLLERNSKGVVETLLLLRGSLGPRLLLALAAWACTARWCPRNTQGRAPLLFVRVGRPPRAGKRGWEAHSNGQGRLFLPVSALGTRGAPFAVRRCHAHATTHCPCACSLTACVLSCSPAPRPIAPHPIVT
jgi:hypothetical protein